MVLSYDLNKYYSHKTLIDNLFKIVAIDRNKDLFNLKTNVYHFTVLKKKNQFRGHILKKKKKHNPS